MTDASTRVPDWPSVPTPEPIHAFDVRTDGTALPTALDQLDQTPPDNLAYRWIHFDLNQPGVYDWLLGVFDETVADALTPKDTRPRALRHANGVLLNLRGVNTNPDSQPEDMVSIRMFLEERRIVTVRIRRLAAVVALREQILANNAPLSVGAFVVMLADGLLTNAEPPIRTMSERVDALEEAGMKSAADTRSALAALRNDSILLRRYFAPQHDALTMLFSVAPTLFDDASRNDMNHLVDRQVRMVEELDAIRERGLVLHDHMTNHVAEKMNRNMLVLSVVAAVFLPLGFLTGLLGVNVGGIPGANDPRAFTIVVVGMSLLAGGLLWWFKSHDWI